jgi:aryl carrier-like protein
VNISTTQKNESVVIRYWTDALSDDQAAKLANTFAQVLSNITSNSSDIVDDLEISKDQNQNHQPHTWNFNSEIQVLVKECVHEVIQQMFRSGALVSHNLQNVNNIRPTNHTIVQSMIDYSQMSIASMGPKTIPLTENIMADVKILAPPDHLEGKLLSVWSELLQIPKESIGSGDNFFELGGDSIIAMQMVGAAREEGLSLTVANIFCHPTFEDMAQVIRSSDDSGTAEVGSSSNKHNESSQIRNDVIQNSLYQRFSLMGAANVNNFLQDNICPRVRMFRGGIVDVFPVTDFQAVAITGTLLESRWMLNYFYLDGEGVLDLKRLKNSVYQLVASFEILRSVFIPYNDRFFQVVLRKLQPSFTVEQTEDLTEYTSQLQQKDREHGPRLGEPYIQFVVANQKDTDRHRIIIRISHAQYDGVCLPSILDALRAAYAGQSIPPTPSFSAYVRDAVGRTTRDHYDYWKSLLSGSTMTDIVRRRGPNYNRGPDKPTVLKRIVRISSLASENITPATVIKAAWSLVLAELSASSDVVFGNVISGRNTSVLGVERIVGPCVNIIPVLVKFQSGWTVFDLLHHLQDQQVANMPYESLGFREIVKHCTEWPDWTNFTTVCQHQNVRQKSRMQLGENNYTIGALGSQEDFADLTVLSTPHKSDEVELCLIFCLNGSITKALTDSIFDKLCKTVTKFSTSPKLTLPSPSELSMMQSQTLDDTISATEASMSSNLHGASKNELLAYLNILSQAWHQVLGDKKGVPTVIDLESSFFDLGGDIMGLAQVTSLLGQQGFELRLEDLVDHPVMQGQLALLAAQKSDDQDDATGAPAPAPEREQAAPSQRGYRKVFGRPMGLVKKMLQPKAKNPASPHAQVVEGDAS